MSQNLTGNEVEALEERDDSCTKLSVDVSQSKGDTGEQLSDAMGDFTNGLKLRLDLCAGENVVDELVHLGLLEGLELVDGEGGDWVKAGEEAVNLQSSVKRDGSRGSEGGTQEGEDGGCGEELHFDSVLV